MPDDPRNVRAKYMQARAAQPGWARTPLKKRLAAITKFRERVVAESEKLAQVLTTEVGKPISQARNELKGVLPRIDFFLAETAKTLRPEKISADAGMEERITHEPLGVVANISAVELPVVRGQQRVRPGAPRRQLRALQAFRVRRDDRARDRAAAA
jgi:acyl-CoA reductase-like NAD-dependent aldehyde dehydrogenase